MANNNKELDVVILVGEKEDQWPVLRSIGVVFSKNIDSVVFVSIGKSAINDMNADADIIEKTAGYWNLIPETVEQENYMHKMKDILASGKPGAEESLFVRSLYNRLIDPSTITVHSAGISVHDTIKNYEQINICKIDHSDHRRIVYDILDRGFRPCFITIRLEHSPDVHVPTELVVGHLQNCGYILLGVHEDKYLFYFSDNNLYDCCHWDEPALINPIITELTKQAGKDATNKILTNLATFIEQMRLKNNSHE